MIRADNWGWRHAGRRDWAVRGLSVTIERGERVLLLGASGSGKSTLLHAFAGVLGGADEGESEGVLVIDGQHPTRRKGRMALVSQDPDSAVVLSRVGDDVAFGAENLNVPPDQIWPRVHAALDAVGLEADLNRSTSRLSGGQKQRLALAGAISMQSEVVLLDEPTANLDPVGITEVVAAVTALVADRERTLVVVEHRVDLWADLVDRVIVLAAGGGLVADGPPSRVFTEQRELLLAAGVWVPGEPPPAQPVPSHHRAVATDLLTTSRLSIGRGAHLVQSELQVHVPAGTSTVITGANGVGKSTLALTLAGLLPPLAGEVIAAEQLRPPARRGLRRRVRPEHPISWRSRDLLTRIGTVFQEPEHQFVTDSVADEIAVGLRALGLTPERVARRTTEVIEQLHLQRLAKANPFTLSGGEKRRLSVGTVLATSPQVVIIDEPTFGQDRTTWAALVQLIQGCLDDGSAVVSVTHDEAYLATLGHHRIELR